MAQKHVVAEWGGVSILKSRLTRHEADSLAATMQALGDPARLQILSALGATGGLNVTDVLKFVDVSQPTVSHHLKVLCAAGLVARDKRGTFVFYTLVPERFAALAGAFERRPKPTAKRRLRAV